MVLTFLIPGRKELGLVRQLVYGCQCRPPNPKTPFFRLLASHDRIVWALINEGLTSLWEEGGSAQVSRLHRLDP